MFLDLEFSFFMIFLRKTNENQVTRPNDGGSVQFFVSNQPHSRTPATNCI
jgi:hypothetical protein